MSPHRSKIIKFLHDRFKEDAEIARQQPDNWAFTALEWSGPNDLVALFNPQRVLTEIEGKLRILERAQFVFDHADLEPRGPFIHGAETALRETLYDLALPYSKHADYDPSWNLNEVKQDDDDDDTKEGPSS